MKAENTPLARNQWQKRRSLRVVNGPYATTEDEAKVKTLVKKHFHMVAYVRRSAVFVWAFPDFGGDSSIFAPKPSPE